MTVDSGSSLVSFTRRRLVTAGAASLCAFGALAQAPALRRVGCLLTGMRPVSWATDTIGYGGLVEELRELGWVEGRNLQLEWRFAGAEPASLPALADTLVRMPVEVIVAGGSPAVAAAQAATRTIPIVMTTVADPVGSGFVESFARPGGNITGMSNMAHEIGAKYLELLLSIPPAPQRIGVLQVSSNPSHARILRSTEAAAVMRGVTLAPFNLPRRDALPALFEEVARAGIRRVIVLPDAAFTQQAALIAELSVRHRVATLAGFSGYAEHGGLMNYSADWFAIYRGAAHYVNKLLRGAKASDLPVQQPSVFELNVNRRAAASLGVQLPQEVLALATRVVK